MTFTDLFPSSGTGKELKEKGAKNLNNSTYLELKLGDYFGIYEPVGSKKNKNLPNEEIKYSLRNLLDEERKIVSLDNPSFLKD